MQPYRENIDLVFVALAVAITLPVVYFTDGVPRIILGAVFLLLLPGYTLMSALFPSTRGIDRLERVALALVFSFTVVSLLALALNFLPWGIRLSPIIGAVAIEIIIAGVIAYLRRRRVFILDRVSFRVDIRLPSWRDIPGLDRVLYVSLAVVVLGSLGVLSYAIASPKPAESITNFYLLGPDGVMEDYPEVLSPGQAAELTIGIQNREGAAATYTVSVNLDGSEVARFGPVTLADGEDWSTDFSLVPQQAGENRKAEFLLYRDGTEGIYSALHLWLDVRQ